MTLSNDDRDLILVFLQAEIDAAEGCRHPESLAYLASLRSLRERVGRSVPLPLWGQVLFWLTQVVILILLAAALCQGGRG